MERNRMKTCRRCASQFPAVHVACSHCKALQLGGWSCSNKLIKPLVLFLVVLITICLIALSPLMKPEFNDYRDDFSIKFVGVKHLAREDKAALTFQVTNHSDRPWIEVNYEVHNLSQAKIIYSTLGTDKRWKIDANEKRLLTVSVNLIPDTTSWRLSIKSLQPDNKSS